MNDWYLLWFYCDAEGLSNLYVEGTAGTPLQTEFATGTCDAASEGVRTDVQLPGTAFNLVDNGESFSIAGPSVTMSSGVLGEVTLQGVDYVAAAFETVDCSACGQGGWYEVHTILWDPIAMRACFVIIYLQEAGAVRLTYALSLPDLSDPAGGETTLPARWAFG